MRTYQIANETIRYSVIIDSNIDRFERFRTTEEIENAYHLTIDNFSDCLRQHRHLEAKQCELILSMRKFFKLLLHKNKLFLHALAMVIDNSAHVIIAPASGGKSTLANQLIEFMPNKAFILSDDRCVIGNAHSGLVVWATPWSTLSYGDPFCCYPIKSICLLKKGSPCSIENTNIESIQQQIMATFPTEHRENVSKLIKTFNLSNYSLLSVKSDIYTLPIDKLLRMMNK